jgi:purine-binding chemotaxis protein CheW
MHHENDKAIDAVGGHGHGQLLTFRLADTTYALPVEVVKEIRGYANVTPVPGAPAHIRGVMNLRGQVIPVSDLRVRFGLEERAYDRFTVIILLQIAERVMGAVVDSVSDVVDVDPSATSEVPDMGAAVDQTHLSGLMTMDDDVVLTLRVDALVGSVDLGPAALTARRVQDAA